MAHDTKTEEFPVQKSDAEWREQLTPEQFRVARQHGTERAFSNNLNAEKRDGIYHCIACEQPVFDSATKYESGSGWPSFYQPIEPAAIGEQTDRSFFSVRTEVHCSNCGAHLGHVFPDGPEPTGLRYCLNGTVLDFEPKP